MAAAVGLAAASRQGVTKVPGGQQALGQVMTWDPTGAPLLHKLPLGW